MENFKEYTPEEWIEKNRHPRQILLISANNEPKEISIDEAIGMHSQTHRVHMSTEIIKKGIQLGRTESNIAELGIIPKNESQDEFMHEILKAISVDYKIPIKVLTADRDSRYIEYGKKIARLTKFKAFFINIYKYIAIWKQ